MAVPSVKTCPECGEEFPRNPKSSAKQWAAATFCTVRCANISRRQERPQRTCAQCSASFSKPVGYSKAQWENARYCSADCRNLARREPRLMPSGYVRVFRRGHPLANRDGYVLEHRLVLYEAGVEIPPGHQVHHVNGDKTDNRLENLEVLTESDHHRHHVREAGFVVNQFGTWPLRTTDA
jgi:hypothetical protein